MTGTPEAFYVSLSPFARLVEERPGEFGFRVGRVYLPIVDPGAAMLDACRELVSGAFREESLLDRVAGSDGFSEALKLRFYLTELADLGWLCHAVFENGNPFATCVPLNRDHRFEGEPIDPGGRYQLSRFCCLRRSGARMLLESPLSRAHVILHDWRAAAMLAAPGGAPAAGIEEETRRAFLQLLFNAGFLTTVDENGQTAEDRDPSLVQWEFHDLFFHSRSREGRHANPYGGVNRFRGIADRPPVVKPAISNDLLELYRPDLDVLRERDVSLTEALESRRSRRAHGPELITDRELGEFLYRTARIAGMRNTDNGEVSIRVYPCAGAAYELEIYPAINQCRDLASGFYQYLPLEHALCRISGRTPDVDWLIENSAYTGHCPNPQIVFQIAARFQRLTWRYGSMAYASILKDVGGLLQTMYLVATAMGLAACALGGGHSDMFVQAAGTNYYEESSVGEFILGRAS